MFDSEFEVGDYVTHRITGLVGILFSREPHEEQGLARTVKV
jgi:heat shock protein HspQ